MRNLILKLIFLVVLSFNSTSQVSIYGSLWENGSDNTCNWYFKDNKACMELKYLYNNDSITSRFIMNSNTNVLTLITYSAAGPTFVQLPVDNIKPGYSSIPNFTKSSSTKEFPNFGACTRYQSVTHESELIAFVYSSEKIDLSRFASFFKNDQIFAMLALNKIEGFPIQAITVAPNGELLRSYLAKEITETLPQGIFDIPNNAIELK